MKTRGFVLIEVLVAGMLFSVAGSGVYQGLMQAIHAERAIRQMEKTYDPLRAAFRRMEKDLRNAAVLQQERFLGKQDAISFPVLAAVPGAGNKIYQLKKIHYFLKNGNWVRKESELSGRLSKNSPHERILAQKIQKLRFEFAYLDEEEKLKVQPFWLEDPYFGIPKAVQVQIQFQDAPELFSKWIAIPQGRWGHTSHE